ncbi:hypothetical protein OQZ33_03835 [Pedobacter sp. MC2016-05]|uniref:hypothetical protein n=1 Tax=Pedobacter sp. MC2016-05 TaxID=2994474 RepID=UPI0022450305|nr:hypothetical protein [Pedobacter sp. MC2016-05]MCX2473455.1 hypothetical protein [Pedobacter sp. MC2016-05]
MNTIQEIKQLSDQELLKRHQTAKSSLIITCILIGALVGVAIYSSLKNGLGFFTFFPLFFVFLIINGQKTSKAIAAEIKNRGLT